MQLKAVVFPEPFGPMSPRISPSLTSKETALSAMKPPKRFVSPWTLSKRGVEGGGLDGPLRRDQRAANGEDAGRSTGGDARLATTGG